MEGPRQWVETSGDVATTKDTQEVADAEAVAFPSLVPNIAGIEVPIHARLKRRALEVLHAIRNISHHKPELLVRSRQEVIN